MSDDVQLLILAVLSLYQVYAAQVQDYPVFARFWDIIARIAGAIANLAGRISIAARLAYMEAVQA